MDDFRKSDPNYVGFVPRTAAEAIDLFHRLLRNGLNPEHYPEAFVHVTRKLNDEEGAKFEAYIIAPQGVSASAELFKPDPAIEAERARLAREADARDLADKMDVMSIPEIDGMEVDDEKEMMSRPSER